MASTTDTTTRWEMQRKQMTREAFDAVHSDYRLVSASGGRYVLENTDRGTALVPVEIIG